MSSTAPSTAGGQPEPPGRVFFQDPAAGTLVPARTTVTIFTAARQ